MKAVTIKERKKIPRDKFNRKWAVSVWKKISNSKKRHKGCLEHNEDIPCSGGSGEISLAKASFQCKVKTDFTWHQ